MRGTITPFSNTSSWLGAWLSIGETLPLPYIDLTEGRIFYDCVY
jgi:hypothetical protein